jgi:hypothetical protein
VVGGQARGRGQLAGRLPGWPEGTERVLHPHRLPCPNPGDGHHTCPWDPPAETTNWIPLADAAAIASQIPMYVVHALALLPIAAMEAPCGVRV